MPYALTLRLLPSAAAPLPGAASEYAHSALFHLLARANKNLADWLHANADRKPFTVDVQNGLQEGTAALRLTLLDDALFPLFVAAMQAIGPQPGLRLGPAHFRIANLPASMEASPRTYAALWEQATPAEAMAIRFVTPTVFRSQKRDVLWPEPRLVWQSWARAWNQHAATDDPHPEEERLVQLAETRITVERYHLQTRHVPFSDGGQVGFVGLCVYGLRGLAEADRRALGALADFAFYAGTGRKTAMGMGQTRRANLPAGQKQQRSG
ncbi:MAG TPA: CRISPR system precrRNA processing endoribonuclease RAMP protein Cas6 [Chthonomonadaceae bacterium]|nr:CRISPR system precrRNA processing endoribonuclease RAMP protein Cas6 [Chthonomonadaceae bacterium]